MRHRLGCGGVLLLLVVIAAAVTYWFVALPITGIVLVIAGLVGRHRARSHSSSHASIEYFTTLSPERFEHEIAAMLRRSGWSQVRWIGGTGDNGADVIGIDSHGRRTVVQCKRYAPNGRVGSPVIQTTIGALAIYRCDRALVITTGGYTPAAIDLAEQMDVQLVDGRRLVSLARSGNA